MSKLRSLTYGVEGGLTPPVPSELLEWTDDDRIVFHGSPESGRSTWDVPVADLKKVGGWMSGLTLVPGGGDAIRLWFTDPIRMRYVIGWPEYYREVKESGVATWVARLRAQGIRSTYVSVQGTYAAMAAAVAGLISLSLIFAFAVSR